MNDKEQKVKNLLNELLQELSNETKSFTNDIKEYGREQD